MPPGHAMRTPAAVVAMLALCAGCAASRDDGPRGLDRYLPYAGPSIDQFRFFQLDGWESVDREHIVLWADPWTAYLIATAGPCMELDYTMRLGMSTTMGTVSRFDTLFPGDRERCPVADIRPLDIKRMNADRAAARAAAREPAR